MRRNAVHCRVAWWSLVLLLPVAGGGCSGGSAPPEAEPQPLVRYAPAKPVVCSGIDAEAIAGQVDLTVKTGEDADPLYLPQLERTNLTCGNYEWVAGDGRFATGIDDLVLTGLFTASGRASITVFPELAGAQDDYRMIEHNYLDPIEVPPGFRAAPMQGWWDDGVFLQKVLKLDPDDFTLGDLDVSRVDVSYAVRRRNAVLTVTMSALAPTPDTNPVLALLHDLAEELLDETVGPLTLTTHAPASTSGE